MTFGSREIPINIRKSRDNFNKDEKQSETLNKRL